MKSKSFSVESLKYKDLMDINTQNFKYFRIDSGPNNGEIYPIEKYKELKMTPYDKRSLVRIELTYNSDDFGFDNIVPKDWSDFGPRRKLTNEQLETIKKLLEEKIRNKWS